MTMAVRRVLGFASKKPPFLNLYQNANLRHILPSPRHISAFSGDSCVIHNGVCIGQDGFGFYVDGDGNMIKKPQMLNVIIGNNVEIGANTCIDRGSWRDTVIGDNSKIDNLVQVLIHQWWIQVASRCQTQI
ncbi:hypothetical protein JHK87_029560 [Glycine soja]|nr:hypothetical protein JHK87_029560 [Glycine soja]